MIIAAHSICKRYRLVKVRNYNYNKSLLEVECTITQMLTDFDDLINI